MREKLKELLSNMDDNAIMYIHNEYCYSTNNYDDVIYSMDDFDEIFANSKPWDIARTCYYSDKFCPAHNYFWFNGYGNAVSSDYITDEIYIDDIIDYIIDNKESFYNDDIESILNAED